MTTLTLTGSSPLARSAPLAAKCSLPRAGDSAHVALTQLHDDLWRVTLPDGAVLGYLERFEVSDGLRFRAKRFLTRQRRFTTMGEFWSITDALETFRAH